MADSTTGLEFQESISTLRKEIEELQEVKAELEAEVEALQQAKAELETDIYNCIDSLDIQALVNRTLKRLKVGSQSTKGKAVNAFVKELKAELAKSSPASRPKEAKTIPEITDSWESKVETTLGGLSWDGSPN